jgi:hypothetical protein
MNFKPRHAWRLPPGFATIPIELRHNNPTTRRIERVIEQAAELGFGGIEILHRQMSSESSVYAGRLRMP